MEILELKNVTKILRKRKAIFLKKEGKTMPEKYFEI